MEEMNIDLSKLIDLIKKNIFFIIITTLLCGLITAMISKFVIQPKYSSSISVYLTNDERSNQSVNEDYQAVMLNQKLVQTYDELLKTRKVSQDVVDTLGLSIDPSEVQKMISLKSMGESQFIKVSITTDSPTEAYNIANQIVISLKKVSTDIRGTDNVRLVDAATMPERPSSPNIFKNTLIGMIFGVFLALSFILIRSAMDTTVKRTDFIEEELGLTVLGTIPKIKK